MATDDLNTTHRQLKAALTAQIIERARELAQRLIEADDLPLRTLREAWHRAGFRDRRIEKLLASPLDNDAIAVYLANVERMHMQPQETSK